jgi:hypothetical protein
MQPLPCPKSPLPVPSTAAERPNQPASATEPPPAYAKPPPPPLSSIATEHANQRASAKAPPLAYAKPPPPRLPVPSTAAERPNQPASATEPPPAYAKAPPPRLSWTYLRNPDCHIGIGSLRWCRQAPEEIQLYCAICEHMKHISLFPRRPRFAGAQWYSENLECNADAPTTVRLYWQSGSASMWLDWQCLECREIQDLQLQERRRERLLSKACRICRMPLAEAPPDQPYVGAQYIHNSRRRHPHGRTCQRCFARKAPHWSVALRTSCCDWRHLQYGDKAAQALHRVIAHIGCTTVYRCPWTGGLERIALFLGAAM